MKKEYRQLTRSEWARITSNRPVLRRIPRPQDADNTSGNGHSTKADHAAPGRGKAKKFGEGLIRDGEDTANDARGE